VVGGGVFFVEEVKVIVLEEGNELLMSKVAFCF
jgi:hypothetical protein